MRRLETRLGVRLLNRTTRSVAPTEAGARLIERHRARRSRRGARRGQRLSRPAGGNAEAQRAVDRGAHGPAADRRRFLKAYPEIRLEIIVEDSFVDVFAAGCDAGVRYDERLEQDMIAVPIGPRVQRFAAAASPGYLTAHGRPEHPRDLLQHRCLRVQFDNGARPLWEFERDGESVRVDPVAVLAVQPGASADLLIDAAVAGVGVIFLFEDWLRPALDAGALVPVLEPWWPSFSGPFLYFPGRRLMPAPLRAFVDFIKDS